MFAAFSVGTALAPNLASFFVFRIMTAFQGTSFLIIGSACIGDIFRPVSSQPLIPPKNPSHPDATTPQYTNHPCIQTDRARHSPLLVPLGHARRPRLRPLHRRHHRHLPLLARHLLAANRPRRRRLRADPPPPARDDALQAQRRLRRARLPRPRGQDVAVDESLARAQAVPLPQPHHRREFLPLPLGKKKSMVLTWKKRASPPPPSSGTCTPS